MYFALNLDRFFLNCFLYIFIVTLTKFLIGLKLKLWLTGKIQGVEDDELWQITHCVHLIYWKPFLGCIKIYKWEFIP